MDFDRLAKACDKNTSLFLMCNPQNPTGRMYSKDELNQLAEFCLDHNIYLCSDEIHCSLQIDPGPDHTSIASLDDEIGQKTITLFSITKTYNIPGLSAAVAVIPNDVIRNNFIQSLEIFETFQLNLLSILKLSKPHRGIYHETKLSN